MFVRFILFPNRNFNEPLDGIVYAVMVSMGFATLENVLYVLLASQLIVCFSGLPSQILNMAGKQHVLRNIAIVSAIINVAGCFILIPRWGIPFFTILELCSGIFSSSHKANRFARTNERPTTGRFFPGIE